MSKPELCPYCVLNAAAGCTTHTCRAVVAAYDAGVADEFDRCVAFCDDIANGAERTVGEKSLARYIAGLIRGGRS